MTAHLDREMLAAFKAMTLEDGQRLEALGVPRDRWIDLHDAELIGFAPITITAGDLYEPAEQGRRHIILAVTETVWEPDPFGIPEQWLTIVDLVAFDPDKPRQWYLRTGTAWAIGFDHIRRSQNPTTPADEGVHLTVNPLEWLRVGGACVLDWSGEAAAELRLCAAIDVARASFASSVHARLIKPTRMPVLSVQGEGRRAA